jgi:nitronate monooxygenase
MTLQTLFGIEFPIVQAPMASVQDSALAAAVSNAGALGSLPCALLDGSGIERELAALSRSTRRPYGVNFFCHQLPSIDAAREAAWRATLAPYYDEYGIDAASISTGPGRLPFTAQAATLVEAFKPAVVSFVFGLPSEDLVARVRAAGAKVVATATTVDEARWLDARGVDAIVAQGLEAGGHRGIFLNDDVSTQVGTMALVPQVVRAVSVPVIAAGGIVDARGVEAARALGAAGAQVGTAYLLTPEATTSAIHRAAISSDAGAHTVVTNLFTGRPARGIVNRLIRELGPISSQVPAFPLATAALVPLRAAAERTGSGDFSPMWAGQNVSGCREVPAAEVTRRLAGVSS